MMKIKSTFNPNVIGGSLLLSLAIIAAILFDTQQAIEHLNAAKDFIFRQFSWFYILLSAFFLFFLLFLALGRYGDIKLGVNEEEAEFSLPSWFALLFTSGIGIGIVFLGVAEPLSHFLSPIGEYKEVHSALFFSIFHWSLNAWAIYGLIALAIAYFGFRYKLPLSLRACFYPFLKEKINGKAGDLIDILGICATLFGVVATLGYSAIRLASAFHSMHLMDDSPYAVPLILLGVFVIAILISRQGIANGLRIMSEVNLGVTLSFMLLVLLLGPTVYLISAFTENIGTYLSGLISAGFKTYTYDTENLDWFVNWTIFYWAWWFSWAPGFGIFIARISRGRTLREFIFGVLSVPSLFFVLWFTVFGNGAIWVNQHQAQGALGESINDIGSLLFDFLNYLPYSIFTKTLAVFIISLFFIVTINFGIYTLNNIAIKDKSQISPRWQSIFWGGLMSTVTLVLYLFGGIEVLQSSMLFFSLPFALLMFIMAWSLLKGLRLDQLYYETESSELWTGENWRARLKLLLKQSKQKEAILQLKTTALLAMRELRQLLIGTYDLTVTLHQQFEEEHKKLIFTIGNHLSEDFYYQIEIKEQLDSETDKIQHMLMASHSNTEISYSIHTLEHDELIADILQQYEIYLQEITFIKEG
ncbi:BCCT family transporter [Rodentibacter trehalosifermentans]|uniref:BCCT family transporter n=1 Tax=Rodentibacter trehalosifermentans TaxID=1908263 RepID=UPI002118A950|nr:BCCT family transporter [Rodentibacter trehalosifermentans]